MHVFPFLADFLDFFYLLPLPKQTFVILVLEKSAPEKEKKIPPCQQHFAAV